MFAESISDLAASFFSLFSKPIKCQCRPYIETSQLICTANQLTGVYMRATPAFNGFIW